MDDKLTAKTAKFMSLENLYVYGTICTIIHNDNFSSWIFTKNNTIWHRERINGYNELFSYILPSNFTLSTALHQSEFE